MHGVFQGRIGRNEQTGYQNLMSVHVLVGIFYLIFPAPITGFDSKLIVE